MGRKIIYVAALHVKRKQLFIVVTGIVILASMWLKDLKVSLFTSAGGFTAFAVFILWVGYAEGVGFDNEGERLHFG